MAENIEHWSDEKLRRKADQESEMASMAASDGDKEDAARRFALMKAYREELARRR
jgi:hypothetical protein